MLIICMISVKDFNKFEKCDWFFWDFCFYDVRIYIFIYIEMYVVDNI